MGLDLSRVVPAAPRRQLPAYALERRARPAAVPLAERMAFWGVPGVSVAVLHGGEVTAAGFGVRDAAAGGAVTPDTLFQAASISKPVTALGALRLVAEGRLDLDADVNGYLRSWQVRAAGGDWRPRVSLRHLLSHTAGTTVHGFPGYRQGAPVPTLLQVLDGLPPANTAPVRVDTVPGAQFRYSGGGTSVVQLVMEEVTGEPFAELMRRLVLRPLGMARSAFGAPVAEEAAAHAHRTGGAPVDGGWHVYPEMGAAALWTTPGDLVRLIRAFQGSLVGERGAFLPRRLACEAATRQPGSEFGLGWQVADGTFGHTGGNAGYRCVLRGTRDGRFGAAVMTNGDDGDGLWAEVLGTVAEACGWPEPASGPAGRYALRPDLVFEVEERDGGLWVRAGGQAPFPLVPDGSGGWAAAPLSAGFLFLDDALFFRQNGAELRAQRLSQDRGSP
jgi:CubicO group peptidase (beta-lactamase class C family)